MSKTFGLGRGLGALIPAKANFGAPANPPIKSEPMNSDEAPNESMTRTINGEINRLQTLPLDSIDPNPYQPRTEFDPEALATLTDSVKQYGILQPLIVYPAGNRYQLLAGERRLRAAKLAGLTEVPVVVRPVMSNESKLSLALIENLQRRDLNVIEEANSYQQLIDEFNYTQEQVAKAVSKPRTSVANVLRVLQLPAQIQAALSSGDISLGHAKVLLSLNDIRQQLTLFDRMRDEHLTVRQAEAAAKVVNVAGFKRAVKSSIKPDMAVFENLLRAKLGAKVEIKNHNGQGSITVRFFSPEELENLKKKLLS